MSIIRVVNAKIVNERKIIFGDVIIDGLYIKNIIVKEEATPIEFYSTNETIIDAFGKYLLPGIIDDQVHFREPGLEHKGDIYTESRAAVAGGVTSFMDMPNTIPQSTTIETLESKFKLAEGKSLANYSFFMGATNDNISELLKVDPKKVCGIKVFMGSSTGNMLVDNEESLNRIFRDAPGLIAIHSENEEIINKNFEDHKKKYGEDIPFKSHPAIRSRQACCKSTKLAIKLAKAYDTRLHILHLSTAEELEMLDSKTDFENKEITSEVCVHHLWFDESDYESLGAKIKCNPAIKSRYDKESLFAAMISDKIDIIATDHAPHTTEEKNNKYLKSPSGIPLVQHSLQAMLEFYHQNKITLGKIVEKMCHNPARIYKIENRGFIKEGYFADLVLVDLQATTKVDKSNILYKCGWSPFEGVSFKSSITHTLVNGNLVYNNGNFQESRKGMRLEFNR